MRANIDMMNRAFTLVEVIVAVVIISVVGLSLLKINANHTNIFKFSLDRIDVNQLASFYVNNYDPNLEMRDYSILELIKSKYPEIKDDEIRKYLDEVKISIKEDEEVDELNLFEDDSRAEDESKSEAYKNFENNPKMSKDDDSNKIIINRLNLNFNDVKSGYYRFIYNGMQENNETNSSEDDENNTKDKDSSDSTSNFDEQKAPNNDSPPKMNDRNGKSSDSAVPPSFGDR